MVGPAAGRRVRSPIHIACVVFLITVCFTDNMTIMNNLNLKTFLTKYLYFRIYIQVLLAGLGFSLTIAFNYTYLSSVRPPSWLNYLLWSPGFYDLARPGFAPRFLSQWLCWYWAVTSVYVLTIWEMSSLTGRFYVFNLV